MAKNSNLHSAKANKNDEFYTQLSDVEKEMKYYRDFFKGKKVLCNCNDDQWSAFFKYFSLNFEFLGLKKLTCVSYNEGGHGKKYVFEGDVNGNRKVDQEEITITELKGCGDFSDEEGIAELQDCDVVVTNPPFSLFRDFVALLEKYNKKYIIIGNQNAITYKEIFPLIKENKMWLGVSMNGSNRWFRAGADYPVNENAAGYKEEDGEKYFFVNGVVWFTNVDHGKRNEVLELTKTYSNEYPHYNNYDAIEVSKVVNIPMDYDGVMGVPITFLHKYNPNQFEIVGCADANVIPNGWKGATKEFVDLYYAQGNTGSYKEGNRLANLIDKDGYAKVPYKRILIRHKK